MLCVDPAAAAAEIRRVLKPGSRLAVAVWDGPEHNPWATESGRALVELGYMAPPDRSGPGMFALAPESRLRELLDSAGFVEVTVEAVELERSYATADEYIGETVDLSMMFAEVWKKLDAPARSDVLERVRELMAPYCAADGSLRLPGRSLVAAAGA
jgi:SAM-dependent methyltransferase